MSKIKTSDAAKYGSIQQINKKEEGQSGRKPIFPVTPIQAVFDAKTGASLEAILAQFNSVYVQYQGTTKDTRLIIPMEMRRAGLTITYMDMDSNTITERANSAVQKDNDHWGLDVNWSRVDELSLSGDISVSANGTWIINGKDTGVKALGPKGDTGLTPWLKTIDNKLHFSYDNVTWEPCSENIAAWFRWSGNKIQISRDNKTWTDLSGKFADNVHIKGYVANYASLPSGAVQGDIYGVGPTYAAEDTAHTNPIYRYYVRNANSWVDNGQFTSIAAGVVQETGDSETEVMSQKAVSEKLSELGSKVYPTLNFIGQDDEQVVKLYTCLNPGCRYKLRIHNPNAALNETTSDKFRLSVSSCNNQGEAISPIIRVAVSDSLLPVYEFTMPSDGSTALRIGIRCKLGVEFPVSIEDITPQLPIKENETDAIGLLNLSQIKRGYKMSTNGLETVDELFFITPYISTSYGDEIEVYLGLVDSSIRFSSYDAEKNYISSYTQNADPRVVKFVSKEVRYLRCSFKIENIGSYIKINGTKIFELTENLYDSYLQYSKIDKIQEGPLYKSYITCSGRTVTNADIINNILPRHIYKIYLTDINPPSEGYSDPEMYKFSIRSYNQDGTVHTSLLSVLGKDEWKSSYIIETPSDASYLYLRARCEPGYKFQYYIEDITSSNERNTNGIINANPIDEFLPKFQSAKKRYYTSSDTTKKEPVVIAHISDIHANLSNVERFLEFTDYWKDYIDILVNTGDTVRNGLNDGVDGYNAISNVGNIINVVGNHDTASYVDGVFDWQAYAGSDCYNSLIFPNVDKWGVVQPNNASQNGYCYFYKDFANNNLRVVFVDIMGYDEAEDRWVADVLTDAKNRNYDVIIATHFAGVKQDKSAAFERMPCNYTTLYELASESNSNQLYGYNPKSYLLTGTVQQYIDNGGLFCGYIQGHYHADFIAKVVEHPKQLIYSIGSSKEGEVRDYNHIVGTRNQDEFQIISIDTYLKTIKLYKVGANVDLYGRHKNSICINYITGEIVAESY